MVLNEMFAIIESLPADRSCDTCANCDNGFCQEYQAEVPMEHRPKGCDKWAEPVPF